MERQNYRDFIFFSRVRRSFSARVFSYGLNFCQLGNSNLVRPHLCTNR